MLHFVLGTTGVGKTKYLYDIMCELAQKGEQKLMFIVPDQSSFETEKVFLELLGPKLSRNIKVFGFSRLCDYVFEQTGNRFMSFADEGIRNVVMNVAVEQVADRLKLFSKRATASDLSQLMLNSIKEYKKCSITSDMLYSAAQQVEDETLSLKLSETALLYDTYNAILEKSYIDPLDSITHICDVLSSNNLFDGYTVAVDSFYGFTSQEYDLLKVLLRQSGDMYVALTTDNTDSSNGDLFFVSNRTKRRLTRICREEGIGVSNPVVLFENQRFNNDELKAVEENIFRVQKNVCEYTGEGVNVYQAKSIYDECEYVARSIRRLVVEDGYDYSDIAVITRQSDKYLGVLDTMLEKYSISYFMDKPQDIDTKPLIKFIMACFDVVTGGFDREDVLAVLKTGLTDFSVEEIADFENYLFIWDLSGKSLLDEFTLNPRGFADEFYDEDREMLCRVENVRKTVVDSLRAFYYDTKDVSALEISKALIKLVYRLHVKENLNKLCDYLEENNELELSSEQIRLYNIFVEILDKMVGVIGDYRVSAKRFAELLHINFVNTDISFIPRGLIQVDIACADRSLLGSKKAVFVIGAIDGEFPHTPVESGVYSDDERNTLSSLGIELSDSIEELVPTEKYLTYKALTSASDKLFVSYYTFSLDGSKYMPSVIVNELPQILSGIELDSADENNVYDSLWSEQSAFDYLVRHYKSQRPEVVKLSQYFLTKDSYKDTINAIEKSLSKEPARITDKALSQKLFGTDIRLSASQIDKFQMCKFEYFCAYGLYIQERRAAKIDSLEYGTMMHHVFEEFLKNHKDDDFAQISEKQIACEVDSILDSYLEHHLGGKSNKSSRFMYLFYRMKQTAIKLVLRVVQEFAQSKFRPVDFELKIGDELPYYKLKINDELTISIKGSIDRVDIMEHQGKKYLRVVDYKTGSKRFCLSDVLYGINLQMLIYMSAVNKFAQGHYGTQITPAGVLYFPAVVPSINFTDSKKFSDAKRDADNQKRLFGIVLDDVDICAGMDAELGGEYIPVKLKGDMLLDSSGTLATLEQFGVLFSQVDNIITQMAQSLYDGDVSAVPAKGMHDACDWCVYKSVCGYCDGDDCRTLEKHSKDEVYDILMGKEGENEERMDTEST